MKHRTPTWSEGLALSTLLDRRDDAAGPVPLQVGLEIVQRILESLEDGTSRGPSTGFITPKTVRLGFDGEVRLTRGSSTLSHLDEISSGYAAPEGMRGEDNDEVADLFSLGIVLFELLSGRRLYDGAPDDVEARILEEPPPDLGEERLDTPPELVELIFELLCKTPEARPVSRGDLLERLQALIDERIAWEGELPLASFVCEHRRDEDAPLDGVGPTTTDSVVRESTARASSTEEVQKAQVLTPREATVIALLVALSAAVGVVARLLTP
jgi:serine/threonine protein kinase